MLFKHPVLTVWITNKVGLVFNVWYVWEGWLHPHVPHQFLWEFGPSKLFFSLSPLSNQLHSLKVTKLNALPKAPRLKKINRDWKNQSEIDFLPKSIENSIWEGFWKSIEKSIFFCLFNFKTWIQNSTENSTENSIEKPIWDNWFCCLRCCMCCNFE